MEGLFVEIGGGIEVEEGEGFARVVMPALPARLGFVKGKRVEAWFAVIAALAGPFMPIALALVKGVHLSRVFHPRDGEDLVMVFVGVVMLVMFEGFMIGGALGIRVLFRPQRVEILLDRNGVRQHMWGPLDGWRVKPEKIQAVVVVAARKSRNVLALFPAGVEGLGTVKLDAGLRSQSIGWAYPHETALTAARELARQIERVRGITVEVRDELDGAGPTLEPEAILTRWGVQTAKTTNGMQVKVGSMVRAMPRNVVGEGFLMVPPSMAVVPVVCLILLGVASYACTKYAALDVAAVIGGIGILVTIWGWLGWLCTAKVSYTVSAAGLEQKTQAFHFWRRTRWWQADDISEIVVRDRRRDRGLAKYACIVLRDGRRVALAVGSGPVVEAMVVLLRRELGMGEGD